MYEPEVDDYVIWNRPSGDIEEGWVFLRVIQLIMRRESKMGGTL